MPRFNLVTKHSGNEAEGEEELPPQLTGTSMDTFYLHETS